LSRLEQEPRKRFAGILSRGEEVALRGGAEVVAMREVFLVPG